ncbi:GspE/PulE/PilB domain-containing protein [Desulforhopalus sp. 52FAK]
MTNKPRLGEILVQEGLVKQSDIDQALRTQVGGNRRLGHILVRMKLISADQLAETISSQLELEICDLSNSFSSEVSGVVPRYLCRRYTVLPLALKENNILEMAMADPCDDEAINNLEHYTGMVIQPLLARQSDIERAIPTRVPLGMKDFFSPQFNMTLTRVGVAACLAMLLFLGGFTYRYVHETTYGTEEIADGSKVYKNHDLILEVNTKGALKFSGRSAFAKGYYSVTFNSKQELNKFLERRQADFSEKQADWLGWAVSNRLP